MLKRKSSVSSKAPQIFVILSAAAPAPRQKEAEITIVLLRLSRGRDTRGTSVSQRNNSCGFTRRLPPCIPSHHAFVVPVANCRHIPLHRRAAVRSRRGLHLHCDESLNEQPNVRVCDICVYCGGLLMSETQFRYKFCQRTRCSAVR